MTTSAPPESEATVTVILPNTASKEEMGEQEAAGAPSSTGKDEGATEKEREEQVMETGAEDCSLTYQVRAMMQESPRGLGFVSKVYKISALQSDFSIR